MSVSQFVGYSVETGAFGDLKPGNGLVFPPAPLLPNKNTTSLEVPTNRPSKYTLFTRDDVVSQRLKFGSAFLSSSWESKIALFF